MEVVPEAVYPCRDKATILITVILRGAPYAAVLLFIHTLKRALLLVAGLYILVRVGSLARLAIALLLSSNVEGAGLLSTAALNMATD